MMTQADEDRVPFLARLGLYLAIGGFRIGPMSSIPGLVLGTLAMKEKFPCGRPAVIVSVVSLCWSVLGLMYLVWRFSDH